jgi:hypothetical protein
MPPPRAPVGRFRTLAGGVSQLGDAARLSSLTFDNLEGFGRTRVLSSPLLSPPIDPVLGDNSGDTPRAALLWRSRAPWRSLEAPSTVHVPPFLVRLRVQRLQVIESTVTPHRPKDTRQAPCERDNSNKVVSRESAVRIGDGVAPSLLLWRRSWDDGPRRCHDPLRSASHGVRANRFVRRHRYGPNPHRSSVRTFRLTATLAAAVVP